MARPQLLSSSIQSDISNEYKLGASLESLASKYNFTKPGISKILKRGGVALRPRGRSSDVLLPYKEYDNLLVYVADPTKFCTRALMAKGLSHGDCSHYWERFREKLTKPMMLLWKDELEAPGLAEMLDYKAGKIERKCSARECTTKYISKAEADTFYEAHHLQGKCNGTMPIGLFYNDELIGCMTFTHAGACRGTQGDYLLQRFAVAGSVPGGAGKLLKAFLKDHQGDIISYSDERYAPGGGLYSKLGFELLHTEGPDYRYWKPDEGRWYAKNACQRKHLIARLGRPVAPEDTERTMALELGFDRCYDLGKLTWLLRRNTLPIQPSRTK